MSIQPSGFAAGMAAIVVASALGVAPVRADKIKHTTAVFAGLDKITGRIISFDVATDETVQFGSLQITPRVCYSRDAKEAPQTDAFVEVEEVETDNTFKKIFSGWMFAASPGLHGIEHPVYDVWLTDCKGGTEVVKETVSAPPAEDIQEAQPAPPKPGTVPRPRQARHPTPDEESADLRGRLPPPDQPPALTGPLAPRAPAAVSRPTRLGGPLPPGNIPNVGRRPTRSFFPTAANPGESARERELMQ
jgi:hypothetical protein